MKAKAIIGVLLVITSIGSVFLLTYETVYDKRQAIAYLSRGITSGSVEEYIEYVEGTLPILQPYHGNTALWMPTAQTDMDLYKSDLESNLNRAKKLDADDPDYSHTLDDLTDRLIEFKTQLDSMSLFVARFGKVWYVVGAILFLVLVIGGLLLIFI